MSDNDLRKNNDASGSRRDFLKTGVAGAGAAVHVVVGAGRTRPAFAAGTDEIRVGLVGCGGRGSGAAVQALKAAKGVKLVAMADMFKDRLDPALLRFREDAEIAQQIDVTPDRTFVGFDAYKTLLAISEVNYVILASPPGFRPAHLKAAVEAGKHVFTEKPLAVDGPGMRTVFEMADLAKQKGLGVGVGLQRRHQKGYLEVMKRIQAGAIGEVVAGRCYWNQGGLWSKERQPAWSDMEWQLRNWLYFTWLSGDHIVEQHIHNIDVVQWAIGKPPVAAVGMGGRQQRTQPDFGHIYDHFAVDFEYPNDVHLFSMSRQIPKCHNDISEHVTGTKGRADMNARQGEFTLTGKTKLRHDASKDKDPYLQEHIDLIESIRKGKPLNELRAAGESNLAAIMGRMAAYTGKRVTWEQALNSKESLTPAKLELGKLAVAEVAIPGKTDVI
jgi:myo-inositol 2-dehydrogenase / D-chiro-inositol 1-dehydrogenase